MLAGMSIYRRNSLPEPPAGRADRTTDVPARRFRWRARHRRDRGNVRQAPESAAGGNRNAQVQAASGETMAAAMQLAIALLTVGLDHPSLKRGRPTRSLRSTWTVWQTSWPVCM